MTSIFIAAGCIGDSTHEQAFDIRFPSENRVVWRHSFPHGKGWPDAEQIVQSLRQAEYRVQIAVMTRNWHCTACSQVRSFHAVDVDEAKIRMQVAYARIFSAIGETNTPYCMVSYESLIHEGQEAISRVLEEFRLDAPAVAVQNGNKKYYT